MTTRTMAEKVGVVLLGAACLFLAFKLVAEVTGNSGGAPESEVPPSPPSTQASGERKTARGESSKLVPSDASRTLPALKDYVTRPLPEVARNPFDFAALPPPPGRGGLAGIGGGPGGGAGSALGPPPIPFRAIGYSERVGVGPEAYLADTADADEVYIVHKGDTLLSQYTVVSITPSTVEVQDGVSKETADLPIPQVE